MNFTTAKGTGVAEKGNVDWRQPDGVPVSCAEKIKVLDQNLAEFRAVALDFLEDAVLMGCDVEAVRRRLADELAALEVRFR